MVEKIEGHRIAKVKIEKVEKSSTRARAETVQSDAWELQARSGPSER